MSGKRTRDPFTITEWVWEAAAQLQVPSPWSYEDIAQEVLVDLFASWRKGESELPAPTDAVNFSWVATRVRWKLRDVLKRERSEIRQSWESVEAYLKDGLPSPRAERWGERLEEVSFLLTAREQQVLDLRILGGKSYTKVAKELGISESTARTHYNSAVRKIQDSLGDGGTGS